METSRIKAKKLLERPYVRALIPDPDSKTYTAMILEFPGCIAQGDSPEEAYARLEEAAIGWLEAAISLGQEIPRPNEENEYSGKFALRMPTGLHRSAAEHAEREHTSLNQFIITAIAERIGAKRLFFELANRLERRIMAANEVVYSTQEDLAFSPATGTGRQLWDFDRILRKVAGEN